ncbi:MAG: hypothetical protein RIM68_13065 [Arenibacter sp.]
MANPHATNTLTVLVSFILGHYFESQHMDHINLYGDICGHSTYATD